MGLFNKRITSWYDYSPKFQSELVGIIGEENLTKLEFISKKYKIFDTEEVFKDTKKSKEFFESEHENYHPNSDAKTEGLARLSKYLSSFGRNMMKFHSNRFQTEELFSDSVDILNICMTIDSLNIEARHSLTVILYGFSSQYPDLLDLDLVKENAQLTIELIDKLSDSPYLDKKDIEGARKIMSDIFES
jgi:hypothetical protein